LDLWLSLAEITAIYHLPEGVDAVSHARQKHQPRPGHEDNGGQMAPRVEDARTSAAAALIQAAIGGGETSKHGQRIAPKEFPSRITMCAARLVGH